MRGKRSRKQRGFKAGHEPFFKRTKSKSPKLPTEKVCYVRLKKEQHALVCERGPGVEPATSDRGTRHCLLRPQHSQQSELEEASVTKNTRYMS